MKIILAAFTYPVFLIGHYGLGVGELLSTEDHYGPVPFVYIRQKNLNALQVICFEACATRRNCNREDPM